MSNLNAVSKEKTENPKSKQKFLNVSLKLDRNLSIFDYKAIFAIDQLCSVDLCVQITEIKYKKPDEFNPNNIWFSEIRSVVRAMDYYEVGQEFQMRINYRLILWTCYVNFVILLIACIIVPITNSDVCGHGLFYTAHFIMAVFLILSLLAEILLFLFAFPKDILMKILESAKGDLKFNANNKFATFLAIVINGWFLVSGVIAKIDMYTDIGFAIEALKCGYVYLCVLYLITYICSISYQCYSYFKLFFKINLKNCVYPVSEQTARLLLCIKFKCLGLIMEKFSLTYYTNLCGYKIHTPKLMALLKSFGEDLPQFIIQIIKLN